MSEDTQKVVVTDIDMKFTSMILFMVKWAFAAIPALIILSVIYFLGIGVFGLAVLLR